MPLEKEQSFTINLGEIVNTRLQAYSKTVTAIRAKQDADFLSQAAQQGFSYDQYATYYQNRLDSEKKSDYPDESYIQQLQQKVDHNKALGRYQDFDKKYQDDFDAYSTGKYDIQSLINETQSAYDSETDPDNKDKIRADLKDLKLKQFSDSKNILSNKISLAANDQSIPELNSMMSEVQSLQSSAMASGNKELATTYELQAQSIKTFISQTKINQKNTNIEFNAINQNLKSSDKLSQLQDLVGGADSSSPVTINSIQYPSEQAYWTATLNGYLSGNGSGVFKDIVADLSSETTAKANVAVANSKNATVGYPDIQGINDTFSKILSNPAASAYADRINGTKISVMSNISLNNSKAILSEFNSNNDDIKSMQDLNDLENATGVSQAVAKQTLSLNIAKVKDAAASSSTKILPPSVLADPKNTTADIAAAYQGGKDVPSEKGAMPVPEIDPLKTQPDLTAIQKQIQDLQKQADTLTKEKTQQPTQIQIQPNQQPVQNPATPQKTINYTVAKGDTLSSLAAKNKTTVQLLQSTNKIADPNKIQIGQQLIIPQ